MQRRGTDSLNAKWMRFAFIMTSALVFLLVLAAIILLSLANRSYGRMDVERQAAQAASILQSRMVGMAGPEGPDDPEGPPVTVFQGDPREELPDVMERILGFAVFGGREQPVFGWGETVPKPSAILNRTKGVIVQPFGDMVVWETGDTILYLKAGPGGTRQRMMRPFGSNGTVVLRFDGSGPLVAMYVRQALIVMLGSVAIIMVAALFWLSRRTQRLQADLDEHRALARLGTAARTLAHEIRNPLSIILMQTSLLERQLGEVGKDALRSVREEANRIELQVKNVKRILGQGNEGMIPGHVVGSLAGSESAFRGSPKEWLDSLIAGFPSWKERVAIVSGEACFLPDDFVLPLGNDPLRSIVVNLVDNALEAYDSMPPGKRALTDGIVRIEWAFANGEFSLSVRDRAGGIPRGMRKRIFDPFFTTKPDGSGVGLNLARDLARASGGDLAYRAEPPDGSRFTLTVPRKTPSAGG